MFVTQLSRAVLRLFCLLAFALCFSGLAHAQTSPAFTITVVAPDGPVTEGTTANGSDVGNTQTFRLVLNRAATQPLTVRVATRDGNGNLFSNGTGTTAAIGRDTFPFTRDFQPLGFDNGGDNGKDVTFGVGTQQINVDVGIIGDRSYEFNENYTLVAFSPRVNGSPALNVTFASEIGNNSTQGIATGVINDDDAPPRVTFLPSAAQLEGEVVNGVPERTAVNVAINVDIPAGRPLRLRFDTVDNNTEPGTGNATAGVDYEQVSNRLVTVNPGTIQFTQQIFILGDEVYEGDEAFTLRLAYSPALVNTVPDNTIITIIDDDLPTYRITDANNRVIDNRGTPGDTTDDIDVTPVGQARASEGNDVSFLIELLDTQPQLNNPNAPPRLVAARSNIVFQYTFDDITATFPADYTNPNGANRSGSFTVPIGATSFRLNVPTIPDGVREGEETFRLRIVNVTGAAPALSNSAVGTIVSVDNVPVISVADASVVEGTGVSTNLVFNVTLSNASADQVTVGFETVPTGTATRNEDYSPVRGRITFDASTGTPGPGSTLKTFSVPIIGDAINEPDETVRVRLFDIGGGAAEFPGGAVETFATGTIIDDDAAGTVRMARDQVVVNENVLGRVVNVPVNFTPVGNPARPVTVDFTTIAGTASQTGRIDYFQKSGRLTFQPSTTGQTKNIPIEIFDDNIRENDEFFTVRLTAVDGAVFPTPTVGSNDLVPTDTVITIKDNEPFPQIRITPASARVLEGNGAPVGRTTQSFNVFLLSPSQEAITLNYKFFDGDGINPVNPVLANFATRGADYDVVDNTPDDDATDGTITFTIDGPSSIPINYDVLEDNIAEPNEFFSVVLSPSTPATVTPNFVFDNTRNRATSTIVDDDLAPSITVGDATVVEGDMGTIATGAILSFPVTLSRPASRPVTFTYSTFNLKQPNCTPANGCDVASDDDYASVRNVPVTIAPGETTATITVRVAPDTGNEFNEQFALVIRQESLFNAVPSVTRTQVPGQPEVVRFGTVAYGTITNDDAGGVITITGPTAPIAEGYNRGGGNRVVGDVANFVVTLPAPTGRAVTVRYTTNSGSASAADVEDLTTGPGPVGSGAGQGQITFFPGDTTRTIALRALADNISEQTETLRVVISLADTNAANSFTVTTVTSGAQTTILDRTPRVTQVTPLIGFPAYGTVAATQVSISGANLRTDGNPRVFAVSFNGVRVERGGINYASDNGISVSVPRGAKTGPLTLILADGSTLSAQGFVNSDDPAAVAAGTPLGNFVVQPVIESFTPTNGVRGAIVEITGRNFKDPANPVTAVRFSGGSVTLAADSTNIVSDTLIRVGVPTGAVTGPISIESQLGGVGPTSQGVFTVANAATGSVSFGPNPDLSTIVEGSTGTFAQPVRNFGGTGDNTFHRPYNVIINPALVSSGPNQGQPVTPQTPITVRIRVTATTTGGRIPVVEVRDDPRGDGRITRILGRSNADGIIDVPIGADYNAANAVPIQVAIVDAGTDNVPPVVGGDATANVRVQAYIVESANTGLFPITSLQAVPFVSVARREVVDSTNQTAIAFSANSTNSFSVPFVSGAGNSVAINDVFNVSPGAGNYAIYSFNTAGQRNSRAIANDRTFANDFQLVTSGRLERGVGYLIVTGNRQVQLNTRSAAVSNDGAFSFNLTRNVPFAATATAQGNSTNGYNFIGFPFNPTVFRAVDFNQATVTFDGVTRSVPQAAAAGLINGQLLRANADGTLTPVTGDQIIRPFEAYFVQIFRDNVTLTLNNPTR